MSEKIALGFGNNVDYEIVWDARVVEDLIVHHRIRDDELSARFDIRTERDLVISILGFMKSSEGGERFVVDSTLLERFAGRFEKDITLGGTSVRAAIAMRKLGYRSTLHLVTQNDHVRRLLPADCPYICSNPHDTFYPHLIVQFPKDAQVRAGDIDIHAVQPNRLIYHSNADNIAMKLNEDFADLLADADVLLISGFNAMQSRSLLDDRLASLIEMLDYLPKRATVFLEDGGYFEPDFRGLILDRLGGEIDIFSMNEDELQIQLQRAVSLRDVRQVRAALTDLHGLRPVHTIVVHTQHWALAHGELAPQYAVALKAGVTMATTRFRYGDDFTFENYRAIENGEPDPEFARFAVALNEISGSDICCVPVPAVQQTSATTIGLGDAFVGGFLPALLT